jgi:hypothetical protein
MEEAMNTKSEALTKSLTAAGVNVRGAMVFGSFAHIDSFQKYHDRIVDLMTSAGFKLLRVSDGAHIDGTSGYRASFTA